MLQTAPRKEITLSSYGSLEVTVSLEQDDAVKTMTVLPT